MIEELNKNGLSFIDFINKPNDLIGQPVILSRIITHYFAKTIIGQDGLYKPSFYLCIISKITKKGFYLDNNQFKDVLFDKLTGKPMHKFKRFSHIYYCCYLLTKEEADFYKNSNNP